jgi:hypothetical protein
MPNEEWRDTAVPGFKISSLGRVLGRRGKPLAIGKDRSGRPAVALQTGAFSYKRSVAHLVCEAWHGPRPDGMWCLHRDDDPFNNTPENLYWGTAKQNYADAKRNGKQRATPWTAMMKLDWGKVREIRARHQRGERQIDLALEYGVGKERICSIVNNKAWRES